MPDIPNTTKMAKHIREAITALEKAVDASYSTRAEDYPPFTESLFDEIERLDKLQDLLSRLVEEGAL